MDMEVQLKNSNAVQLFP